MTRRQITRRAFLGLSTSTAAAVLLPDRLRGDAPKGPVTLHNEPFALTLNPGQGLDCTLTHSPSGTVLAQGPYFYSVGAPAFDKVTNDNGAITLVGTTESGIEVSHTFRVHPQVAWLEGGNRDPQCRHESHS